MEHPENSGEYKGLVVNAGIEQPSSVNPYLKRKPKKRQLSVAEYVEGIVKGDVTILSRAVTLVESVKPEHQAIAQEVIEKCLPYSGNSVRVGISGVPGAGKSTSIDVFGLHVLEKYGGKLAVKVGTDQFLNWLDSVERAMLKAETDAGFYAPGPFKELVEKPKGVISLGAKMGEGWLLTAEMIELVQGGYGNIVCAQPFGCLPNHIVGKGMVNKIRALYPSANITPIDYDPSATRVNQENRIKLMLAVAKERLNAPAQAAPLTAEEIAGGAPRVETTV